MKRYLLGETKQISIIDAKASHPELGVNIRVGANAFFLFLGF
jgi:hypothetical protein